MQTNRRNPFGTGFASSPTRGEGSQSSSQQQPQQSQSMNMDAWSQPMQFGTVAEGQRQQDAFVQQFLQNQAQYNQGLRAGQQPQRVDVGQTWGQAGDNIASGAYQGNPFATGNVDAIMGLFGQYGIQAPDGFRDQLIQNLGQQSTPPALPTAFAPGYGGAINAPPGMSFTHVFRDRDGDGIDDRAQPGPGMQPPQQPGMNWGGPSGQVPTPSSLTPRRSYNPDRPGGDYLPPWQDEQQPSVRPRLPDGPLADWGFPKTQDPQQPQPPRVQWTDPLGQPQFAPHPGLAEIEARNEALRRQRQKTPNQYREEQRALRPAPPSTGVRISDPEQYRKWQEEQRTTQPSGNGFGSQNPVTGAFRQTPAERREWDKYVREEQARLAQMYNRARREQGGGIPDPRRGLQMAPAAPTRPGQAQPVPERSTGTPYTPPAKKDKAPPKTTAKDRAKAQSLMRSMGMR